MDRDCHNVYTLGPVNQETEKFALNFSWCQRRTGPGSKAEVCLHSATLHANRMDLRICPA